MSFAREHIHTINLSYARTHGQVFRSCCLFGTNHINNHNNNNNNNQTVN